MRAISVSPHRCDILFSLRPQAFFVKNVLFVFLKTRRYHTYRQDGSLALVARPCCCSLLFPAVISLFRRCYFAVLPAVNLLFFGCVRTKYLLFSKSYQEALARIFGALSANGRSSASCPAAKMPQAALPPAPRAP
jgi:hypothetical protein